MSSSRARAAGVVAVLAVLISGCGGGGTDAYTIRYIRSTEQFKRSVDAARTQRAKSSGLRARVPAAAAFKASVDKLASDLDHADPPGDVAELNARAVDVLHRLSDDLDALRRAAAASDKRRVDALAPQLQTDQADLQDVFDQIDQALRDG